MPIEPQDAEPNLQGELVSYTPEEIEKLEEIETARQAVIDEVIADKRAGKLPR